MVVRWCEMVMQLEEALIVQKRLQSQLPTRHSDEATAWQVQTHAHTSPSSPSSPLT